MSWWVVVRGLTRKWRQWSRKIKKKNWLLQRFHSSICVEREDVEYLTDVLFVPSQPSPHVHLQIVSRASQGLVNRYPRTLDRRRLRSCGDTGLSVLVEIMTIWPLTPNYEIEVGRSVDNDLTLQILCYYDSTVWPLLSVEISTIRNTLRNGK